MPAVKAAPQARDSAPVVVGFGVAATLVLAWLRFPSVPALWLACSLAASFASAPQFTGPKDASGQPTAIGDEARLMLRWRRWGVLRRAMWPSEAWLPNLRPAEVGRLLRAGGSGRGSGAAVPWRTRLAVGALGVVRALSALGLAVAPLRASSMAGAGAALVAVTLPVDSLPVSVAWANAAAAYVVVAGWAHALRQTADEHDAAPAVSILDLRDDTEQAAGVRSWRSLLVAASLASTAGWVAQAALRLAGVSWLFWPLPLLSVGVAAMVLAAVAYGRCRDRVRGAWRQMLAARAAWAPRWAALKQDVRLLSRDAGDGWEELVFDAPATLGAAGAMALNGKLVPFLGTGVVFALLPVCVEQDGATAGLSHPTQFRAVLLDEPLRPNLAAEDVSTQLLSLWCEVQAADGVRGMLGQAAPVATGMTLARLTVSESPVPVWSASFIGGVVDAVAAGLRSGFGCDAIPLPIGAGASTVVFGEVDVERAVFEDPQMSDRLAALAWELRWKQRWRDIFKTNERSIPVPQWAAKQDAVLALPDGDVTIHAAPHMSAQGDEIGLFMSSVVAQKLPTTLASAPFCTVVGWPDGVVPGGRNPQAFTVLWSDRPVPSDPTNIPGNVSKVAAKWALAAAVNAAFDAAKLPRPEVATAQPMTRRGSDSIWRVQLRLYDGVTLDAVKRALSKMRLQMGGPRWLIATRGEFGCDLFVGAHPNAEGIRFASRAAKHQCMVADLEQAFTSAGLDSPFDGSAPTLQSIEQLESNEQVTRMVFTIPSRMGIGAFQEQKALEKLRTATGNAFFEIRPAESPAEFVVLASEVDPMPTPAPFMWNLVGAHPRRIPFATRVEGAPCIWDLELDSHLLVLGQNGSGKGIAMTAIVTPMLANGWDVFAADPIKGFNDFAPLDPWLRSRCTTYEQTAALMRHMVGLIEERKHLNAAHGVSNVRDLPEQARPPMAALFLDEFTSLVIPDPVRKPPPGADEMALSEYEQASRVNELKATITAGLGRLVREGRATGVVVVAAGQKLTSDLLDRIPGGRTIKSQFSRLAMGKMSFGDLVSAFSDAQKAMGLLGDSVPRGRGVFESTAEAPFAVQTWWAGGSQHEHFGAIVARVAAVRAPLGDDERFDFTPTKEQADAVVPPMFGARVAGGGGSADEVLDVGEVTLSIDFGAASDAGRADRSDGRGPDREEPAGGTSLSAAALPETPELVSGRVLVSAGGRVREVELGDEFVEALRAAVCADEVTRAVVVDERVFGQWMPGVPMMAAVGDLERRHGVQIRTAGAFDGAEDREAWLGGGDGPATSDAPAVESLPKAAPVLVPAPATIPVPVPLPPRVPPAPPVDLFAPPPEPIVPSNGVRFDPPEVHRQR